MPTLKVQVSDYKVLIPVAVSKSYPSDSPKVCDALLDTGASRPHSSLENGGRCSDPLE